MIDRLEYAAALAYSPRGTSVTSILSRSYRDALKRADPLFLDKASQFVANRLPANPWPGFFGPGVTLVPVPGSAPRRDPQTLWIAERLCDALLRAGVAAAVWPTVQRHKPVPKSAFAAAGERPLLAAHVDSLRIDDRLAPTTNILLVDDFVTKGRTMLACATVLNAAMPDLQLRGFALIRTMGLIPDVERVVDPVVGEIRLRFGDASREP